MINNVTNPSHYVAGLYKCDEVEKALSDKMEGYEDMAFYLNPYQSRLYFAAFEYIWRAPFKNGVEDLEKAAKEIQDLVASFKE